MPRYPALVTEPNLFNISGITKHLLKERRAVWLCQITTEHQTTNLGAGGSNPSGCAIFFLASKASLEEKVSAASSGKAAKAAASRARLAGEDRWASASPNTHKT